MLIEDNTGGSQGWNIVKTLGRTSAKAKTSNSTFSLKDKNCPSASSVGIVFPKKNLTGESTHGKFWFKQRQIFFGKKREPAPERRVGDNKRAVDWNSKRRLWKRKSARIRSLWKPQDYPYTAEKYCLGRIVKPKSHANQRVEVFSSFKQKLK
jgi:hypothetical protein